MEGQINRHEPLYLKHRPQALCELVGQTAVTRTLSNAIEHDRIAHAYLFTGPRGTGKTSSARILAKSLNCKNAPKATVTACIPCAQCKASREHASDTPCAECHECTSCLEIRIGNSPAVIEIDAASNNSVDDARILIERAPLLVPGGRYKVYIIDECHMLTKEAFNALLKTIEDPPPQVIFILATTEEHKVIPTIVSRCQRLMFRLVTQGDLTEHLRSVAGREGIEISEEALSFIARRSGGGLRDALGLLDQSSLLSSPGNPVTVTDLLNLLGALQEDVLLNISFEIGQQSGHNVLTLINKLLQEGREPAVVVQELSRHFLNLIKSSYLSDSKDNQMAGSLIVGTAPYLEGLSKQVALFKKEELSHIIEALDRLEQTCRRTTQPAMHLEIGLLALCHRQGQSLLKELSERVARLEGSDSATARASRAGGGQTHHQAPQPPREQLPDSPAAAARSNQPELTPAPFSKTERQADPVAPPEKQESELTQTPAPAQDIAAGDLSALSPVPDGDAFDSPAPESPLVLQSIEQTAADLPEPVQKTAAGADVQQPAGEDLDYVWSEALEELQRRHLPAFSLVSTQAFPLSITEDEICLGATTESWQKILESKASHFQGAVQSVLGRQLRVRIKVVAREISQGKSRPRDRAATSSAARSGSLANADDADDADSQASMEPARAGSPAGAGQDLNGHTPVTAAENPAGENGARREKRAMPAVSSPSRAMVAASHGNESTIVREAYKLFEGPGSRLIG